MAEPLIRWHPLWNTKSCKLRALSNECCLDFIGQRIYEISHFSSLRHCLRPSKWLVSKLDDLQGVNLDLFPRYPSEPLFDAESKLCTHLIVAPPTRELQPDFASILALPKLEKLTAPNFRLIKDDVTDESPLANAPVPCCFPFFDSMSKHP